MFKFCYCVLLPSLKRRVWTMRYGFYSDADVVVVIKFLIKPALQPERLSLIATVPVQHRSISTS